MTRWWHAYVGTCGHINVNIIAGDSPMNPEQLVYENRLTWHLDDAMCSDKCGVDLVYVRSWDHEPSNEERELAGLDLIDD